MRVRYLLALAAALALASLTTTGCSIESEERNADTAASVEAATPPAGTDTATTPSGQARTFTFKGTVDKIDRERNRLTLTHEKIGDWMDAMTMPFPIADPAMLDQVQQGKAYTFTIDVMPDDSYKLTSATE